jgi:citryl-CoA lyase
LRCLSTFPGLIAHISEEMQSGAINRIVPDDNVTYARDRRNLDEDCAAAGW